MRVAVAFDHRGVALREAVLEALAGHDVLDLGTHDASVRVDYPDKAREVGEAILAGDAERGIIVCGSGAGVSVAACKILGVRAATVWAIRATPVPPYRATGPLMPGRSSKSYGARWHS